MRNRKKIRVNYSTLFGRTAVTTANVYARNPTIDEVEHYRQEPQLVLGTPVLPWWRDVGTKKYPKLAALARKYLAVPATSAASERLFSLAQHITTGRRNGLDPDHAAAILFLKMNPDCIPPVINI